jgi:2-polyprenyl-3-methyl-5-hydroxy-6-metoxy-1,4-benzoquinol methylase
MSGIDVVPELIEKARTQVTGDFRVASYEDVYERKIKFPVLFDGIVINFALIGTESTEKLLSALPGLLKEKGKLFIQTLWPQSRKEINDYVSGWKTGSWDGLGGQFTQPYEWYFRTGEDWRLLLEQSGFRIIRTQEPIHPNTGKPCSLILTGEKN